MKKSIVRKGKKKYYEALVIGGSLGAMPGIKIILRELPKSFGLSVVIVTHRYKTSENDWIEQIGYSLKEAQNGEVLQKGMGYVGPANYHLIINPDRTFGLDVGELVNYARPSIDVLFESAADVFGPSLIGLLLSGNGVDGVKGLQRIHRMGGLTMVQDPQEAESPSIPQSAMDTFPIDHILSLNQITYFLKEQIF